MNTCKPKFDSDDPTPVLSCIACDGQEFFLNKGGDVQCCYCDNVLPNVQWGAKPGETVADKTLS